MSKDDDKDDDILDNRHDIERPPYNIVNPRQSDRPSRKPSSSPTASSSPTVTSSPSASLYPTGNPTITSSPSTSLHPSVTPTQIPSSSPTISSNPSTTPTQIPSSPPTISSNPSVTPTQVPSYIPTISTYPSISASPSNLSTNCTVPVKGNFGSNPESLSKERLAFRYEVELNTTYVSDATSGPQKEVDIAVMEAIIIPRIEAKLSDSLLPIIFQRCNDGTDNLSSDIVGMSAEPDDVISGNECNTNNVQGNVCYPIDGEMSIFFESNLNPSSRRLQQRELEMSQLKERVKEIMNSGELNDAHPAIIVVTFMDMITNPLIIGTIGGRFIESESLASRWWVWILIAAGIGLLLALALLVWRQRKDQEDENYDQKSDDYSSIGSADNIRLLR